MNRGIGHAFRGVLSLAFVLVILVGQPAHSANPGDVENGKKVAFDSRAGNCLSCHLIVGGESPGNVGPPLMAMKARFPDRQRLRGIIWDITATRPEAMMPPFGKYQVISEQDIDDIVEYLYTL